MARIERTAVSLPGAPPVKQTGRKNVSYATKEKEIYLMPNVINLSAADFESEVLLSTCSTLVDFWAPWCAPCQRLAPVFDELASERAGSLKVVKVNVDIHSEIAAAYGIDSIPTVILFEQGEIAGRLVGFHSKADLERVLDKAVA